MKLLLNHNGVNKTVEAEIIDGQLWLKYKDETYTFDATNGGSRRKKTSAAKTSFEVAAPMPGKITKIFAQAGQKMSKGQAVIVMEAMKMEYTLKSDVDAVVDRVQCQIGDQVKLSQILVQFEKSVMSKS